MYSSFGRVGVLTGLEAHEYVHSNMNCPMGNIHHWPLWFHPSLKIMITRQDHDTTDHFMYSWKHVTTHLVQSDHLTVNRD